METPQADFSPHRFSSEDLPERDRVAAWRDFFAPRVFGGEIDPLSDDPIHCNMTVRILPGLSLVSAVNSPLRFSRTTALLADGHDDYGLHVNSKGATVFQRGREIECGPGDAVIVTSAETGMTLAPRTSRFLCLNIGRAALSPLLVHPDDGVPRRIAPDTGALRYLLNYLCFLEEERLPGRPGVSEVAAMHIRDLFALVLGATRDAAFVAEGRGLRAARLAAIKRFIGQNLSDRSLSVQTAAARHGLTPRTVQRMFEEEGATFSDYVLGCRLTAAYRMLNDARYEGWTVSAIALEAGFGDLSYFNRCFRRRFGASPTEIRSAQQLEALESVDQRDMPTR